MGPMIGTPREPLPTQPAASESIRIVSPAEPEFDADFPALLEAFERDCNIRNMTHESIRRYISAVRILRLFCDKNRKDPIRIGSDGLIGFLTYLRNERRNSPKTVQNVFNALSTFFGYLEYIEKIPKNPIPPIRTRYVRSYKSEGPRAEKRLLSVEEMTHLISVTMNVRDQAILILFAKTGIRRNELITLDVEDIDLANGEVRLKPAAKRSNRMVFFDSECATVLSRWLSLRHDLGVSCSALFSNASGNRIDRTEVYDKVIKWARFAGFHDPSTKRSEKRFGPHCFRHWFTTHLIRSGMPRDYIKELRGDARREAIDIYNHIDPNDLKRVYLKSIPKLFAP